MELKAGYKQTEVGVIPEDWDVQPLLKAVHIANGQVSPKHEPYKSMILVAPDHIESSTGKLLSKKTAADQGAISGKYMFESGDIVYSKIRPYLRKAILADFSGLCSADMYPLKPAPWASGGYILAVILGHQFTRYAESVSVRSGMPKINRAEMADFTIAVPPLPEQLAIGSVLADIDRLIRDLEFLIAKKRDIKQAAMQELLTGTRRLPGFEGEWEVKKLGDSALLKARIGWQGLTTAEYLSSGNYFLVTGTEFESGYIAWNECHFVDEKRYKQDKYIQLRPRDILVTKDGTIGKVALVTGLPGPATLNSGIFVIRTLDNAFSPEFFYYLLCSQVFSGFLGQLAAGSTINHLYQKDFVSFLYRIPPTIEEQAAIANILNDIDSELIALKIRLNKTRAIKQGMMQELLTGKIRLT
jgi:type I restriction enzyme S subunit